MGIQVVGGQELLIERVDSMRPPEDLWVVAQQISRVMQWVQTDVYARDLGLTRIDKDPAPDPYDDDLTIWRADRIASSGPVEEAGLEFIRAVHLGEDGQPSRDLNAIAGLLVLTKAGKHRRLCEPPLHRPTEIFEIDVTEDMRGQGLGTALLRFGLADVHPEDRIVLDVARPNVAAQGWYADALGFKYSRGKPKRHGVFDVEHIGMYTAGVALRERLGLPSMA